MTLSPGTRLGPYEIASPLGAGGMGEVFRARDTKLNRDVAIKVLPAAFAQDAKRVQVLCAPGANTFTPFAPKFVRGTDASYALSLRTRSLSGLTALSSSVSFSTVGTAFPCSYRA